MQSRDSNRSLFSITPVGPQSRVGSEGRGIRRRVFGNAALLPGGALRCFAHRPGGGPTEAP